MHGTIANAVVGSTKTTKLPMVSLAIETDGKLAYENLVFSSTSSSSENPRTAGKQMKDIFADRLIRALDHVPVSEAGNVDGAFNEFVANGYHKRMRELVGRAVQLEVEEETTPDGRVRYNAKNLTFSGLTDDVDGFTSAAEALNTPARPAQPAVRGRR